MDALTIYCFESTKVIHLEDIGFKLHIPIRIYKHYMIFFLIQTKKGFRHALSVKLTQILTMSGDPLSIISKHTQISPVYIIIILKIHPHLSTIHSYNNPMHINN